MEYGAIVGSKPPPKPMNVMKGSEQITQREEVKTSSGKTQKRKQILRQKQARKGLVHSSSRSEEIVTIE